MRIDDVSYRFGKEVVVGRNKVCASVLAALINTQHKYRTHGYTSKTGSYLEIQLTAEGWGCASGGFDGGLVHSRVGLVIEFGARERLYWSYCWFEKSHRSGIIDVGILILNGKTKIKPRNKLTSATINRVKDDLHWLESMISVPLWVVSLK